MPKAENALLKLILVHLDPPPPSQKPKLADALSLGPLAGWRADLSRHGYRAAQFEDAFARFLPPEPNIRTLKRGSGEKT